MALNGDSLGAAIAAKIKAISNVTDDAELLRFCNAIGEAIVEKIQSDATVIGKVTSGAGAGGDVQGTVV